MKPVLNDVEVRVLGSLIEKEISTPGAYPLTLNALTNACNQKSNRDPVVSYDELTVQGALDSLHKKRIVGVVSGPHLRVAKYRHNASIVWGLDRKTLSVLAELLLRGPQTAGEIRTRTSRMYEFRSVEQAQEVLDEFAAREEPLAVKLPLQSGFKEVRFAHLLAGEPDPELLVRRKAAGGHDPDRLEQLETEFQSLKEEFESLKEAFEAFRSQFQ